MVVPSVVSPTETPDHEPEREQAVHDALPELGLLGELVIEMERLRVVGERAEQNVVVLAHRAPQRVVEHLADLELFEVQASHRASWGRRDLTVTLRGVAV